MKKYISLVIALLVVVALVVALTACFPAPTPIPALRTLGAMPAGECPPTQIPTGWVGVWSSMDPKTWGVLFSGPDVDISWIGVIEGDSLVIRHLNQRTNSLLAPAIYQRIQGPEPREYAVGQEGSVWITFCNHTLYALEGRKNR